MTVFREGVLANRGLTGYRGKIERKISGDGWKREESYVKISIPFEKQYIPVSPIWNKESI
jgi:hypothetical protein